MVPILQIKKQTQDSWVVCLTLQSQQSTEFLSQESWLEGGQTDFQRMQRQGEEGEFWKEDEAFLRAPRATISPRRLPLYNFLELLEQKQVTT